MQEAVFIRQNMEKWKQMEEMVGDELFTTPDDVVWAYNEITSDLAFAQTQYPGSPVTAYLNQLALSLHRDLYRNRHTSWAGIVRFWTHEIPLAVYEARKCMLASFIVFTAAIIVGVISTLGDSDFPRVVLGDYYVEMTLRNIENGTPMAVYSMGAPISDFMGITFNNILVSFFTYTMGIFTSFGSGFYLMANGIMVGAFVTFFIVRGLFLQSFLAIMLHGTLELSAIVIAGAAGFTLGNGWLFPGTYSRIRSFLYAGRRSLKILVSTLPIFVIAGFIESFFTRYTDSGDLWRVLVIVASLAFVLFYYVYLPVKRHRDDNTH